MNRLKKMKTVIILTTVLLTGALFASCNSDDGGSKPSIVDTWKETSSSSEFFENGISQGVSPDVIDADNYWELTFNIGGTFSEIYAEDGEEYKSSGTYTVDGDKVSIDPETFKIVDGKLYVFYNKFFNNTLTSWNKDEQRLKKQADANWKKIIK